MFLVCKYKLICFACVYPCRQRMHHVGVQQAEEHTARHAAKSTGEWRAEPTEGHGGEARVGGRHVSIPGREQGRPTHRRGARKGACPINQMLK